MSNTAQTVIQKKFAGDDRIKTILTVAVVISLPLLMAFPTVAGWLAATMAVAGLTVLAKQREMNRMDWCFAAICLVLPFSYVLNMLMKGWATSYLDRPSHLLFSLMIFYLIGCFGIHRNSLFYGACAGALTTFFIAIYSAFYLGEERVSGLGGRWNAVPFGNFSLLLAFYCLCGTFSSEQTKQKKTIKLLLGIAGFASGLFASFLSGSRGGWLALPVLIILCLWYNTKLNKRTRTIAVVMLITIIAAISMNSNRVRQRLDTGIKDVSNYLSNPDDLASRSTSSGIRLAMWKWGTKKFIEHPFIGIGYAAYTKERDKAVKTGELPDEFGHLANVHNEMINSLALGGIISGAALIVFWITSWRFFLVRLKKAQHDDEYFYALCGLLTIAGIGIFSMTEGLFGTSPGTKALLLTLAIPAGALRYSYLKKQSV